MLRTLFAAAALPCALIATNAVAQTSDSDQPEAKEADTKAPKKPRRFRISLGPELVPSFPGADTVSVGPLVDVVIARGDDPFEFEAADESIGFNLFEKSGFSVGPAVNIQTGRKRSEVHADIDEVGTTIELGGFVHYWLVPSLRAGVEVRQGVGGHKGLVSNVSLDYVARDRDRWLFAIGPRLSLANERYQDAYFQVTPRDAAGAGLPLFKPEGFGAYAVGANVTALYQLSSRWGLYSYAKYDRLIGDAARSPIVRELGSRNQLSGGIGLSFTFGGGIHR